MYISDFCIWETNRMTLFCNLFIERPSYKEHLKTETNF